MNDLNEIKNIEIKQLIETETGSKFIAEGNSYYLPECPFCSSGAGENASPAFKLKKSKNYFKCFSCDTKGTTIDFILIYKKLSTAKDAIKYLVDNHLNGAKFIDTTKENTQKTDISKRIYQIKMNDTTPATEYLKSRGVDTAALPKGSYFYNPPYKAIPETIVFLDSKESVINQRYFKPHEYNGKKTKFRNTGELNGKIYDCMYKKSETTLYIHEAVINALSMPKYSSIALFSSTNKIDNPEILRPFTENKTIVLCGDHDTNKAQAGQNFNAHYADFLTKNNLCKEVKILQLPEKTDCNDLLKQSKLDVFLADANNYQSITVKSDVDVLKTPIETDSKKPDEHNNKHGFYLQDGVYYFKEYRGNKPSITKLSNFVMQSLFHLVDGSQDTKRILKIQRNTKEISIVEVRASQLNLDNFEVILKSQRCTFLGNTFQLKNIFAKLMDSEIEAHAVEPIGYIKEYDFYAFADCIVNNQNEKISINDLGILKHGNKNFYLPAFAANNLDNPLYEKQRKYKYLQGNLDFKSWANLCYQTFEIKGCIGIQYAILSIFRDIVFNEVKFFPFLFLFGELGVGKTSFVESILHLWGTDTIGTSLSNATTNGLSRIISQKNNAIEYFKEYKSNANEMIEDLILSGYDGAGRTIAEKTTKNITKTFGVNSGAIFDGNELPTTNPALFSRMILLTFEHSNFTDNQIESFKVLRENSTLGLCQITKEILQYRDLIKQTFKKTFQEIYKELIEINKVHNYNLITRTLNHIALLLTPYIILKDKIQFPYEYQELVLKVIEYSIEQTKMLDTIKPITIFWEAMDYAKSKNQINSEHYRKEFDQRILYIKYEKLYPYYVDYCKKNSFDFMSKSALLTTLTSSNNKYFFPNDMPSRKSLTYIKHGFGSCYRFRYESDDNNTITISGVSMNL